MVQIPKPKPRPKQEWVPTEPIFRKFLLWLDEGNDSKGGRYLEMRRRLVCYFDRKQCIPADELADETLNRVARRLAEEGTIIDAAPAQYCYVVAKYVFLEHLRSRRLVVTTDSDLSSVASASCESDEPARAQSLLECLERCLAKLFPPERDLILEYYRGDKREKIHHRRELAEKLALTMNALSIRACRIRNQLEACVVKCSEEQ